MLEHVKVTCTQSRDINPIYGDFGAVVEYEDNPSNKTPYTLEASIKFSYSKGDPTASRVYELLRDLALLQAQQVGE